MDTQNHNKTSSRIDPLSVFKLLQEGVLSIVTDCKGLLQLQLQFFATKLQNGALLLRAAVNGFNGRNVKL